MKKIIFCVVIFMSLLLIGCTTPGPDQPGGNPVVDTEAFDKVYDSVVEYVENNIPYLVTEDLTLIEELDGAYIEWSSSNEDIVSFYGSVTPDKSKAIEVTLSYKVTLEDKEKVGSKDIIVSPVTIEEIQNRFEKQFSSLITRDYNVKDTFYDLFTVQWYSTDESLFDSQGKYHKPRIDKEFQLKYTIKYGNLESDEKSINLIAVGQSDLEKIEEVKLWLVQEQMLDLYLTSEVVLPTYYEPLGIEIKWSSTNEDVVSKDGKVTQYVFERYLTLIASFDLGNGSGGSCKFECIVAALDTSKMSETEILENYLSAIAMKYYGGTVFSGNAGGCNLTYGHLNFYENKETEVTQMILPETNANRTGIKTDVKFVIVHDTGNMSSGATAKANATYCKNSGATGSSTGWHYTTGNDGVYQTIPEGEVGYHAHGSATAYASFVKTNVKATWKKPNISLSSDGYIMINNIKSDYKVPKVGAPLASDGPIVKIGDDGYYYISKLYHSSLNTNATQGGNASSIGIESAVNSGTDYYLTSRITAKLVAELCMRHNVDLSCVLQHNTTSGKDCPNGMRSINFWYTFKDMVNIEMFAKTYFKDYDFKWTGSGDIDDTGRIKLGTTAKEVNYSVVVSKDGNTVLSKSYTTKIN